MHGWITRPTLRLARCFSCIACIGAALAASGAAVWGSEQSAEGIRRLGADAYARAERFLSWNEDKYTRNLSVDQHWIGSSDRFWYTHQTEAGKEFVVVDAATGEAHPAFNHDLLARALSTVTGKPVDARKLPFESFEFRDGDRSVEVSVDQRNWRCSLSESRCSELPVPKPGGLVSPDGRLIAFRKGNDIWVRSADGRMERPLSRDGEDHYSYGSVAGAAAGSGFSAMHDQGVTVAVWSPDSNKLLTVRLDERKVLDLNLLEMAPKGAVRPVLHSYRYALPGDTNEPSAALVIFDVASSKRVDMKHDPLPVTSVDPILDDRAWWSQDGKTVYVIPREEGEQRVQLLALDAETGATHTLIEESGKTYVEIGGPPFSRAVRTLSDGRIVWYSERSDWGHLYLYDTHGKLIRQLTSGAWKVMDVVRIDEQRGRVYFTAVGREAGEDPYQRHLYVVNLNGSGLRLLTPENADHEIRGEETEFAKLRPPGASAPPEPGFSPSGRYFVETFSRPDLPSTTVLRNAQGRLIKVLEQADISALKAGGLTLPEPFSALAADGTTRLYGSIYRPSRLDPARKYPIIDVIYPGPQAIVTPKTFERALFGPDAFNAQALAEVGLVVINIDGRGTPFRSKSFHDISYGDLAQAGNLDDHIAGIRQLAARYSYMDLDRVGITGHSGGGFASTRAILAYPDFYKVAVSSSGNHDQRGYLTGWGPTYQGLYRGVNYDAQINARLADRLKGKLFLIHGELDDNVHPALTMQVVDALIKAHKDFDFLLLPGQDHLLDATRGYLEHRRWDYFVRNLMEMEPPANYRISEPKE